MMTNFKIIVVSVLCVGLVLSSCADKDSAVKEQAAFTASDWPAYGGQKNGNRYTTLKQINRDNVAELKPAWQFDMDNPGAPQTQPIVIDGVVYAFTPTLDVIALDGASGELLWSFSGPDGPSDFAGPSRGLSMWKNGDEAILFAGVVDKIYALDPANGQPIAEFGEDGALDMRTGLPGDTSRFYISLASPGVIYQDLYIVGFRTGENLPAAPGDIRAFDVRTGELVWSFHTIPEAGDLGADTWPENARELQGGANAWAGFALDEERGIVYAPTGSAAPDFFGGNREGDNLFANSLLALDAATGERIWHFQAIRHDIWDRDFPSPPSLVTVQRDGKTIDAVAQPSKQGYLYLFDRVTGEPIFPIEEFDVPPSPISEERAAPTQRLPTAPAPFARQTLTADMLTTRSPEMNEWAREVFSTFLSAGEFTPFRTEQPVVLIPGFDGGAEWGGSAIDPYKGIIYTNSNDIAWTGQLAASPDGIGFVEALYQAQCAVCHGIDKQGAPPEFPSLTAAAETLSADEIENIIRNGAGRMPGFPALAPEAVAGLTELVLNPESASSSSIEEDSVPTASDEGSAVPYRFTGYHRFFDPDGYPAVAPPWGTLNAIDLNTGEYLWKIPFGEHPELKAQGMETTGSENYGGPVLTESGLLFIGATLFDQKMRAFDAATGELLWEYEMPYSGMATPAVYMVDGKQYIVILASNARNPKGEQGSAYIAFALPE
jgi:quinoprotein glucose dehydrogenase